MKGVLVVSNQSGKSNVINKLKKLKINISGENELITNFLTWLKVKNF